MAAIGIAFGMIVFVHEAGHFIAARLSGMAVHEFSIGFGRPLLFWFRRGETQYSFRLWPFFSFVRIAGMEPGDEHPRGFHKKSRPVQAFVLATGCVMNLLLAVAIYAFMGAAMGMPVVARNIEKVFPDSPAAEVGLAPGDRLLGVEGEIGLSVDEIREAIEVHAGEPVALEVERDGSRRTVTVTPRREMVFDIKGIRLVRVPVGRIGIAFSSRLERMGIGRSVLVGFNQTYQMIRFQVATLVAMLARTVPPEFLGPVGVVHVMYGDAKVSWSAFLSTFALITIAIAFANLMPIPPLDGSRLVIVALEAIRRKPFDKRKEIVVHLIGFALLLGLVVILTYRDILRILTRGAG